MGKEMQDGERDMGWKKAIPEALDRLQSRVLVCVVGAMLVGMSVQAVRVAYPLAARYSALPILAAGISLGFGLLVRMLRAATAVGAVCGGMICFVITFWTGRLRSRSCGLA